jgi:hypothetical protein
MMYQQQQQVAEAVMTCPSAGISSLTLDIPFFRLSFMIVPMLSLSAMTMSPASSVGVSPLSQEDSLDRLLCDIHRGEHQE